MLASPSAAACTSAESILLFSFSGKEQDFKPLKDIFSHVVSAPTHIKIEIADKWGSQMALH